MKVKGLFLGTALGLAVGSVGALILSPGGMPAVNAGADRACCNGDTNGDGNLDISDAVYLLSHLFTGGPAPVPIAPGGDCSNFEGRWAVEIPSYENTCGLPGPQLPFSMSVEQDGCEITVISGKDPHARFKGTVCGRLAQWSGEQDYLGGLLTLDSIMSLGDGNTVDGMTRWNIQGPDVRCGGVEVWRATPAE